MRSLIRLIRKAYQMADPQEGKVVMSNVMSLSWLQIITYISPIVLLPYLFRVLGPDKFGLIAFAQAFVQYFIILTDYSFNVSATKEISIHHEDPAKINSVFAAVMTVKTILLLISLPVFAAVVYFVPKFQQDWIVYALSFGAVVGSTLFPLWFFQGIEKMSHIANLNIFGAIIYAVLIFLFVKGPNDYLIVPLVTSCVSLIIGVWAHYIAFQRYGVSFHKPDFHEIRRQLTVGIDIFISFVAVNTYTTTRVFAVGMMTNNTLTGFYFIAERIANAVQTFPLSSFSQAIFPRLSKIFQKNQFKALEIMLQVQLIALKISLICLPIIFCLAPIIIRIACGGDYPAAVFSLQLLLISVFFVGANAFRVQFLLVCGRTDIYSKIHITMALAGLPLLILLIYHFSYIGAALATVIIEGGIFVLTYANIKKLKFS